MRISNLKWAETVKSRLSRLLESKAGTAEAVVFDFDNSLLIRNMGDPVSELLCQGGFAQLVDVPKVLSLSNININTVPKLKSGTDLNKVYEKFLEATSALVDRDQHCADAYAWAVWSLSGTSLDKIVEVIDQVHDRGIAKEDCNAASTTFVPGTNYPRPFVHEDMIDLIADFMEHQYKIYIVSSSMPWTVRRVVQLVVNPGLLARGVSKQIKPQAVYGICPYLLDGQVLTTDHDLLTDQAYAELKLERLREIKLSDKLQYPLPCFSGKAEIIKQNISSSPYLVVGDSRNDAAMFSIAQNRLWIRVTEKAETKIPELIAADRSNSDKWIVQTVRSVESPQYLPDEFII